MHAETYILIPINCASISSIRFICFREESQRFRTEWRCITPTLHKSNWELKPTLHLQNACRPRRCLVKFVSRIMGIFKKIIVQEVHQTIWKHLFLFFHMDSFSIRCPLHPPGLRTGMNMLIWAAHVRTAQLWTLMCDLPPGSVWYAGPQELSGLYYRVP